MLNLLDQVIEKVLETDWPATPSAPAKPGFYFALPDEDWRIRVIASTGGVRLNLYLYEVRENREFRRASWEQVELPNQTAVLSQPPTYFDCHYLVSAWSAIKESEQASPIPDEHQVLSEALRVLVRNPDVNPAALGIVGGGPVFQNAHIYLNVAPPESPRVLNDFWSTMKQPWRPAIQLIATAPLDLLRDAAPEYLVITLIQHYSTDAAATGFDEVVQIGGWVLKKIDNTPIAGAIVQRMATTGGVLEETRTDARGRYAFVGLKRGDHDLTVSAQDFTPIMRTLTVPDGLPDDRIFKLVHI